MSWWYTFSRESLPMVCLVLNFQVILELLSTDYVAALRAEVTHWWELYQRQHRSQVRLQVMHHHWNYSTTGLQIFVVTTNAIYINCF